MKKVFVLILLLTANFIFATVNPPVRIGYYDVTFNGVTNNQDGTSTWTYTVAGTGSGQDLSHWSLALCADHEVINSNYPENKWEVITDPGLKLFGIKWDIGIATNQSQTFVFTLDDQYEIIDVQAGYKAGQNDFFGTVPGPSCNEVQLGSLGDKVWLDADKDGIQDAGEAGIPGVTVKLYTCADVLVTTKTTNANGNYSFTNLTPGDYYVLFEKPAGYTASGKDLGTDNEDSDADAENGKTICTTLASGENDMTWDAGFYPTPQKASLGDKVWLDTDKDGIQDAGEAGIPGVTVKLYTCADVLVTTKTTNANGNYSFTNLTPGDYYVLFEKPAGYTASGKDLGTDNEDSDADAENGKTICTTLASGENDMTWDAGFYPTPQKASLGDKVWLDTDKDGIQDAGEAGIPGVTVKLYTCADVFLNSITTNANGNYLFTDLQPGGYYIHFVLPIGYMVSPNMAGNDEALDSNPDSEGKTVCVTLSEGENLTIDAGLYPTPPQTAGLGDLVWNDLNRNGIQDNGEAGIPAVTVELRLCDDHSILAASDITDANGLYHFSNLTPGIGYFIKVIAPMEYPFISLANQGVDDTKDSDLGQDAQSACIILAGGENNLTIDAGLYKETPSQPDLKVEKTVDKTDPDCGETVTYTIKVTNLGPGSSTNIVVQDLLPVGLNFISSTPSQGSYNKLTGEWNVGNLAANAYATLSIVVAIQCSAGTTIDLGPATGYNLFVLTDLTQPSADTQGKIAVGNNASLSGYSVADLLPPGSGDVLIVGNNLTYTSGSVHGGNVVYGGTSNLPINAVTVHDGTVRKQPNIINFTAAAAYLQNLSAALSAYNSNGTTVMQWGGITLTGTDPALNVFSVSGSDLGTVHTVTINAPKTSIVIVNINGYAVNWKGGLYLNGVSLHNVIYNFYQAANLSIGGIDVQGVVLAPLAALNYSSGIITGQAIVKSMTGSGQFNLNLFTGEIPVEEDITNLATLSASDPADPNPANNSSSVTISMGDTFGDNDDDGDGNWSETVPVPTASWPVDNAIVYTNPPALNWSLGTYASGLTYELQCVPAIDNWPSDDVFAVSNTMSFNVPYALAGGVKYAWRVRSTNGVQKSEWSVTALFTMAEYAGGEPVIPTASWPVGNPTEYNNPPTLSWYLGVNVPGLTYEIQCVPAKDNWPGDNIFAASSTTSFKVPVALTSGVQYAWRVRSTNGVKKSDWSTTALFTMVANAAGEPVVPIASWPVGNPIEYNNPPTLNWYLGAYVPGLSYEIQCVPANDNWPGDNTFATSSTMSFNVPIVLTSGVQYAWRVRSTNGVKKSGWSATAVFTVAATSGNQPVVPTPSWPVGNPTEYNNPPTLSWYLGAYVPGLTYEIQCVPAKDNWPLDNIVATSNTTSFPIPIVLSSGVQYAWRVRSTNGITKSGWSATAVFTMASITGNEPIVPTPSWPVGNPTEYNSQPTLSWYLGASAAGLTYEIQCVPASDDWPNDNTIAASSTTSFHIPVVLTSGVQYAWRVRSTNGIAKSGWSTTALFTMAANNSVVQPITGSPVNDVIINTAALQLYWYLPTATSGISTYEVQVADNPNFQDALSFNSADPNVLVNGLVDGKEYFWKVRSIDAGGNSSYYSGISQFKVNSTTTVEEKKEIPTFFELSQNYPNPFNPSTTIQFSIPIAGQYTLKVYDMLGQEVASLLDGDISIGIHNVTFDAGNLTSGTYLYRLAGNNVSLTNKMLLIK